MLNDNNNSSNDNDVDDDNIMGDDRSSERFYM